MPRRKKEAAEERAAADTPPKPKARPVKAVHNPIGNVTVNLTTPNGNDYHIEPRTPFEIAPEDVDWFFGSWDWRFRQRLCRVEEYKPKEGYHDPKGGEDDYRPQAEYHDETVARQPEHQPRLAYEPEPTEEQKAATGGVAVAEDTEKE